MILSPNPDRQPLPFVSAGFRAGDRWCAVGDSITHIELYTAYIYLFHILRNPRVRFEAVNAGISGDTAERALARLTGDILNNRPSVTTIMLGMNDVGRPLYAREQTGPDVVTERLQAIEECLKHWRTLVRELQAAGSRVLLMTPSPFDQTVALPITDPGRVVGEGAVGVNDGLAEIAAQVRRLGEELNLPVVDLHAKMERLNHAAQQLDPQFSLIGPDRIHPGPAGHLVMASLFLEAQGIRPEVSVISVDAVNKHGLDSRYGKVRDLKLSKSALEFVFESDSLPFPRLPEAVSGWSWSPVLAELNQEKLQVHGLDEGDYQIYCDGEEIALRSEEALARGINLADLPSTPQLRQAEAVAVLMRKRRALVEGSLRAMALIEQHFLRDVTISRDDFATVCAFLDRALERERHSPLWYDYLGKQIALYRVEKPREIATRREIAAITEEMWSLALPRPRKYSIRRIA